MPLDLSGFVAPEQKFEGLYKIGDAEAQKVKQDQAAKAQAQKQLSANKKAMQDSLKSMMKREDYFTGSLYDPQINQKFFDAYSKANDFIEQNPNATDVQLNAYMAPQLRDLASYSVGAKTAKTMLDDAMKNVPDNTGIDKQKLYEVSRDKLFKNPDGSIKDVITLPTSQYEDPIAQTLINEPEKVYTPKKIDDWLKNIKVETKSYKHVGGQRGKGGVVKETEIESQAQPFMEPVTDDKGNLVYDPKTGFGDMRLKYDEATSGGETVTIDNKPVKLATDDVYKSVMNESPEWLQGQFNLHYKEYKDKGGKDIIPGSPQEEVVKKAILYDYLSPKVSGSFKRTKSEVAGGEPTTNIYLGERGYDPTKGGKLTGVILDEIKDSVIYGADRTKPKAIIKQGSVTNADGTPYTGKTQIAYQDLPGNMTAVLKAGGIELPSGEQAYIINVKDGIIESMETPKGTISRADFVRSQQAFDKEAKGQGYGFGAPSKIGGKIKESVKGAYQNVSGALKKMMPQSKKSKKEDPLDLGL